MEIVWPQAIPYDTSIDYRLGFFPEMIKVVVGSIGAAAAAATSCGGMFVPIPVNYDCMYSRIHTTLM